jgi:TATA-binding protein-associated factor
MPPHPSLQAVLRKLQELKAHALWEVRQSGLMGVKCMLAARSDASEQLLPLALPAITRGLQDGDDDVRAAAAEALVPVAGALFSMGLEVVQQVGASWGQGSVCSVCSGHGLR